MSRISGGPTLSNVLRSEPAVIVRMYSEVIRSAVTVLNTVSGLSPDEYTQVIRDVFQTDNDWQSLENFVANAMPQNR